MSSHLPRTDERAEAAAAGYGTLETPMRVEPDAARMLPVDAAGVGVALAGEVLMVVTDHVPSPAEFEALERASGMAVTVTVASPEGYDDLRADAEKTFPAAAPRALGPILAEAIGAEASEVLLRVGDRPRIRVAGEMIAQRGFPVLAAEDVTEALAWFGADTGPSAGTGVATASYAGHRWRLSPFRSGGNPGLRARRLPVHVPRLEDLGLPSSVVDLVTATHGLVIFSGPGGAGKTTSAAALADRVNATRQAHILTIEDAVEYRHHPLSSAITQQVVGVDVDSFAAGIQDAERHGPDVIVVGELHDVDAVRAAVTAAQAGHLVITTVRAAASVEATLHRLLGGVAEPESTRLRLALATCLLAVVAQQLVTGTEAGQRQAVCEVLLGTDAVRALLRQDRLAEISATIENSVRLGMTSMDRSLAHYVASGRLEEGVAQRAASHADRFAEHLRLAPANAAAAPAVPPVREPGERSAGKAAAGARRQPAKTGPSVLGQPPE